MDQLAYEPDPVVLESKPQVLCLGCHIELTREIYHSSVSKNLILCKTCKILFKQMDKSSHLFLITISLEAFLKLDRSGMIEFDHHPLMTVPLLKTLIKEESDWRLSEPIQMEMAELEETGMSDWIDLVTKHQHEMMEKEGFIGESNEAALSVFRRCNKIFPDDPYYENTAIWLKYNKAGYSKIKEGEIVPDLPVYDCKGKEHKLYSVFDPEKPNLVLLSSYS